MNLLNAIVSGRPFQEGGRGTWWRLYHIVLTPANGIDQLHTGCQNRGADAFIRTDYNIQPRSVAITDEQYWKAVKECYMELEELDAALLAKKLGVLLCEPNPP